MNCDFCNHALMPGWVNYGPYKVHWGCYYKHFRQEQSRMTLPVNWFAHVGTSVDGHAPRVDATALPFAE